VALPAALQIGGCRAVCGLTDEHIAALEEPGRRPPGRPVRRTRAGGAALCHLLTSHPGSVEQHDLEERGAHLPAEEVFELVVAIATATGPSGSTTG
jgi:hypothetical protein